MADVNSIQEEQEQEQEQAEQSSSTLQKLLAPLQNLSRSPLVQRLKHNKNAWYSIAAGLALLVILLLIIAVMPSKKTKKPEQEATQESVVNEISQEEVQKLISAPLPTTDEDAPDSSVDNLIIKGNMLYDQGYRQEAYQVFGKVADFSQSIASYNLGTMELKSQLYHDAIAAYNDGIQTGQNVSVSAINAAVAAFKIQRFDLYGHYIKIANDSLSDILNEPFYSYAYALVSYYEDKYFEALSPLLNPNSLDFSEQNHRLAAHIFTIFGDDSNALEHLQAAATPEDNKSIGLLYARKGEYEEAVSYLGSYISNHPDDVEALMALQLARLKLGQFASSAQILDRLEQYPKLFAQARKTYPIKLVINPLLFDMSVSQAAFWGRDFSRVGETATHILFYFAPYRVFDAKKALSEVSQANAFTFNIAQGKKIFIRSQVTAKIDKEIIRTLVSLDSRDLREGLDYLQAVAKSNPNHATLYYNLGLVCAQLGRYDEAYTHFLRAYHLDQDDFISGIFAVILGRISHKDTQRTQAEITQRFYAKTASPETEHIRRLVRYMNNNRIANNEWAGRSESPFNLAISFINALNIKDKAIMQRYINDLKEIYPNDLVVNILSVLTRKFGESLRDVGVDMHILFRSDTLDLRPLYHSWLLPRILYVYMGFITGSLQNQAKIMEDHIIVQKEDPRGLLQTLGQISIFQKEFQKAYGIYNTLIDEFDEKDSRTLFLAAVAAVGAGRREDAGLLLQLAKMETTTIYEARYALGLLYQEAANYKAAKAAYSSISLADFRSEYFDFQIDAQKIYAYELESKNKRDDEEPKDPEDIQPPTQASQQSPQANPKPATKPAPKPILTPEQATQPAKRPQAPNPIPQEFDPDDLAPKSALTPASSTELAIPQAIPQANEQAPSPATQVNEPAPKVSPTQS